MRACQAGPRPRLFVGLPVGPGLGPLVRPLVCIAILVLSGCGSGPAMDRPLRIAVHSEPLSLDPHFQNEINSFSILFNVYEGLSTFDAELNPRPGLAESWENPDERTWRLRLRRGVRFHDGRELTSRDVVASLERANRHPQSDLKSNLVELAAVRALDELTIEVTTHRPLPVFLNKLASVAIVPAGSEGEIFEPVGTGPYRMLPHRRGQPLRLRADPLFREAPAAIAEVEFVPIRDPEERARRLLLGEVDLAADLTPEGAERVARTRGFRVASQVGLQVEYLGLHADDPVLADPRVREAIDRALDREALVRRYTAGHGEAVGQLVSREVHGFEPALGPTVRDLPGARRLLAEAGYPNGLDLTLEMREGRRGEPIAEQLAEAGVRVRLVVRPFAELYARMRAGQIAFYYGGVVSPTGDASDVLDNFAHSRQGSAGYGVNNFVGLADRELDDLVEHCSSTLDRLERRDLLQQAMRRLASSRLYLPLLTRANVYGVRDELDWTPRIDSMLLAREARWRATQR